VHVTVRVQNVSHRSLDFVEIYDAIPETFELAMGENYIITQIAGRQIKEFSIFYVFPSRGVYRIGPIRAIIMDKIGFYCEEDTRDFYTEVLVYPSYEDVRRMDALSKKRQIGKMFGKPQNPSKRYGR